MKIQKVEWNRLGARPSRLDLWFSLEKFFSFSRYEGGYFGFCVVWAEKKFFDFSKLCPQTRLKRPVLPRCPSSASLRRKKIWKNFSTFHKIRPNPAKTTVLVEMSILSDFRPKKFFDFSVSTSQTIWKVETEKSQNFFWLKLAEDAHLGQYCRFSRVWAIFMKSRKIFVREIDEVFALKRVY